MHRKNGFTMVEIVVTISIIAILATIVIYGVGSMLQSSKGSSTRVILQNAESIYDEWRRAAGADGRAPSQCFAQAILPGSLDADNPANDRAAKAIRITRAFMYRMNQVPAVRKMIGALPADRLLTFPEINPVGVTYAASMAKLNDATIGECWRFGRAFICYYERPSTTYPDPTDPAAEPGTGGQWPDFWLETSNQTPVFRDAWGNPLIIFPACGFIVGTELHTSHGVLAIPAAGPYWSGSTAYRVGEFVTYAGTNGIWRLYRCINANTGQIPAGGVGYWEQIPTRPFFASAGPDGVFYDPANPDTLKDNLYSFER